MTQVELKIKTAQIGRCGEMLVQYRLLLCGIESAATTTDSGVDLVAYSPRNKNATTIQVKTNLKPKRSGSGRGKPALNWWLSTKSPAQYVALVDLSSGQIWLLSHAEMLGHAQQNQNNKLNFYMWVDAAVKTNTGKLNRCCDFKSFLLENRVNEIFGV